MRLLADECVYRATVDFLRKLGHDIVTVQEINLIGHPDNKILACAIKQGRVLITNDMHFSNIIVFPPSSHLGVIVLKIRPRYQRKVHKVLSAFLASKSQEELRHTLVIIDRNKYRIRR